MRYSSLPPLLVLVLLLAACSAPAVPLPAQPPAPPPVFATPPVACLARGPFPPLLGGLAYGVNAFLLGTDTSRVLALTTTARFGWVRQQIHWHDIEGQPGQYIWAPLDSVVAQARANNLHLLLSIVRSPPWAVASTGLPGDSVAFARFLQVLASRYRGQVSAYQIWNEPNLARENGGLPATPATYLATLRAAYPAIKAGDPCALVVSAALAATTTGDRARATGDLAFLEALYQLDGGAFRQLADIVGLHPGGGPYPPDELWPRDSPGESARYFRHIDRVRELMLRYRDNRQAWITEVGWAVAAAPEAPAPVSEAQQAEYLLGAMYRVRNHYPWITAVFVWNLNFAVTGSADDEKSTFGILKPDWSPRQAYLTLQVYLNDEHAAAARALPVLSIGTPLRPDWQARLWGKSRVTPVVATDGTVYTGSDNRRLYAFAPGGGLRWSFDAPGGVRSAPALLPDGGVVLLDSKGILTALAADGTLRWQQQPGSSGRGSPLVLGEAIYVSSDNRLVQFDLAGNLRWSREFRAPLTAPVASGDGQTLYLATQAGEVLALDRDGQVRWQRLIDAAVVATPAPTADGGLLVGDAAGALRRFDADDGSLSWWRVLVSRIDSPSLLPDTPLIAAPPLVAADGTIYLSGRDGALTALDADGMVRWRFDSQSDLSATAALLPDGSLAVGTLDNRVLALSPAGRLRWQLELRGSVRSTLVAGADGRVYISTIGGVLYALAPAG